MPSCKTRKRLVTEMASEKVAHSGPASKKNKKGTDSNNNNDESDIIKKVKNYEKYSLRPRSIQNRIETEKRQKLEPKKQPKPKQRPPPLSKYRRKTANARERSRMREINTAFDQLQRVVPAYPVLPVNAQTGKACEKLTKITTLRLAMNYIEALGTLLNNPMDSDNDISGQSSGISSSYCESNPSSVAGGSLTSGSEFSPASSYAMSPLSSCSPAGPDCFQTVMRSVVSPAAAAALNINAANICNLNLNGVVNMMNPSISQVIITPATTATSMCMISPQILISHQNSPISVSPHTLSSASICSSLPLSTAISSTSYSPKSSTKLPPISTSLSSALLRKSMSTFAADCVQLTTGAHHYESFCGNGNNSGNRTGSLSSLTESDLSEYASDLLSDEGSTLDDPMFEDIIGVGVGTDLDFLLQADLLNKMIP